MSVSVLITDGGTLATLDARLSRLAGLDIQDLLGGVMGLVESQTRRRIGFEKKAPDGTDWARLAPSTEKQYKRKGKSTARNRLLLFEGELLDSIQSQVSGLDGFVGSNKEYAAVHQFGSGGGGITAKPIPAREYLGISDENRLDIERLVGDFLDRSI